MTDITRLLASLKRRSSHVKDFGDDITFVKLEDLDALVEALEKAQSTIIELQQKCEIDPRTHEIIDLEERIDNLESFRTAYMEWGEKTDWVQTDKRFDVLKPWGKHRADVLKAYIERLELRIAELESEVKFPGVMRCNTCGFSRTHVIATPDGMRAGKSEPENCPNGCGPMWHDTYRRQYDELHDAYTALRESNAQVIKSRDHYKRMSEEGLKQLSESRTVTVKLPDDEDGQAYGFGKWANGKLPATAGTMPIAYCEDAWRAAFEVFSTAAGIKWEAE
ncbi:TPA: hypothetical protein ACK1ZR_003716 [Klebsiella michiganensis]